MGGIGSSSKRKSTKRKRDKKKKSRRKGLKRHRRDYDSASSFSDDDSLKSEDTSSFTSKSDRRRRKSRKKRLRREFSPSASSDGQSMGSDSDSLSAYDRKRKHSKTKRPQAALRSTKKRDKKRFASSSSDSDDGNSRKRKRAVRDAKPRKKSSRKRSRKYSSSSSSYDLDSCSTCQSRSSSGSDGEHPRTKVIVNEEKERLRGRKSNKTYDKYMIRSPSYSSYGQGSDHGIGVDDYDRTITFVGNPRRLKSVIAFVEQSHDEGENRWEKDPHKEEIVYDREDYPSPKSLDSYEGATKIESGNNSPSSTGKRVFADEEGTEPGKLVICEGDPNNFGEPESEGPGKNNFDKKEMDASVPATALGGDDLELILRQKALENLRKFRGKHPRGPKNTDPKTSNEHNGGDLPAGKVDSVLNKSMEQDSPSSREINSKRGPSLKRDFSQLNEVKQFPDGEYIENEHGTTEQTAEQTLKEDRGTDSNTVLSKHESRGDTVPGAEATTACNSDTTEPTASTGLVTGENSSDQHNEDKDGSQFEQRTMSVMRGGEMVQVSYKVYIPKKAPALARRQLRR